MTEPSTTEPQHATRCSVDPTPIYVPLITPEGMEVADAGLLEAFRQGWVAARHWPNQPLPRGLTAEVAELDDDHVTLTISWPPQ